MNKNDKVFQNIQKQIQGLKDLHKTVTNKRFLGDIAKDTLNEFKSDWQKGIGTDPDSKDSRPFDDTAPSTKNSKLWKQKTGKLDKRTNPSKSNMIDTGELIDSTKLKFTKKGFNIENTSEDRDDAIEYNKDKRPLFYLRKSLLDDITTKVYDKLAKETLKKLNKK